MVTAPIVAQRAALKPLWDEIVIGMARDLGLTGSEWKSYGVKHGWALQLRRGKRNIVHLAPCQGSIRVLFILGDRAVAAARAARLGAAAAKLLDEAPRYPEGTGVRLEVSRPRQIPLVTIGNTFAIRTRRRPSSSSSPTPGGPCRSPTSFTA